MVRALYVPPFAFSARMFFALWRQQPAAARLRRPADSCGRTHSKNKRPPEREASLAFCPSWSTSLRLRQQPPVSMEGAHHHRHGFRNRRNRGLNSHHQSSKGAYSVDTLYSGVKVLYSSSRLVTHHLLSAAIEFGGHHIHLLTGCPPGRQCLCGDRNPTSGSPAS